MMNESLCGMKQPNMRRLRCVSYKCVFPTSVVLSVCREGAIKKTGGYGKLRQPTPLADTDRKGEDNASKLKGGGPTLKNNRLNLFFWWTGGPVAGSQQENELDE